MDGAPTRGGTFGGLLAIVLWSATVALARHLSERLGPLTAAATVYLLGGVLLLLRDRACGRSSTTWRGLSPQYLWGCGGLFTLYTILLYAALGLAKDREQTLEVGLVNYLWPTLTLVLSLVVLKRRATWLLLPGTALALTGIVLVMTQGSSLRWVSAVTQLESNPAAFGMAFLAAFAWALYSNLTRRWAGAGAAGAVGLFVPATGMVFLLLRAFFPEHSSWSWGIMAEAAALGAMTAVAYELWDLAMRRGDLVIVAACSYFTPFLSTLVSCLWLRVVPGARLWFGCLLLVLGSVLSWLAVAAPFQSARHVSAETLDSR